MSGFAVQPPSEAVLRNAPNASIVSGSGLEGHPRALFDVYRTAGEFWADFTKVLPWEKCGSLWLLRGSRGSAALT